MKCRKCKAGVSYCHRCPDMDGGIMPGCMGTAVAAHHEKDMSYCTCDVPRDRDRMLGQIADLRKRLERLERNYASK